RTDVVMGLPLDGLWASVAVAIGENTTDVLDLLPDLGGMRVGVGLTVEHLNPVLDRRPETEDDPAAGETVDVHGGHGDLERVAGEGDLDPAGELDPRRDGGDVAHPHERVAVDLGHEDAGHAQPLDLLCLGGQHVPGHERGQEGPLTADVVLHGVLPGVGGRRRVTLASSPTGRQGGTRNSYVSGYGLTPAQGSVEILVDGPTSVLPRSTTAGSIRSVASPHPDGSLPP